jgi:hypothetical protein
VGSLIQFFEQPDVFDGNNGLIGEGFEELDLRRIKRMYVVATRVQSSNEFRLLMQGNDQ